MNGRCWALRSARATQRFAAALARTRPADAGAVLVLLRGELGAGKTSLVAGFVEALGGTEPARSPTYSLVERYEAGSVPIVHADLYRLHGVDELEALGLRDLLEPGVLVFIEWPERGADAWPADLAIRLDYDGEGRRLTLAAPSGRGADWLERVSRDLTSDIDNEIEELSY